MGLMIHSLSEFPANVERSYYVYLLDYGWNEPLGEVLDKNFEKMAKKASQKNAVVLRGVVGSHFSDEVLSWHKVNGQPGEEILPAILITTRYPHEFHENCFRDSANIKTKNRLLLIPLRKSCKTASDVATLVDKLFRGIEEKRELINFEITKELKAGRGGALVDALILQPNISGIGINIKTIIKFLKEKKQKKAKVPDSFKSDI